MAKEHKQDKEQLNQQAIFPDNKDCPVRDVLTNLTGKWPMLILLALMNGPERFSNLQHRIEKISRRMLTMSLRRLEQDGYIERTVFPEVPPRVEYALTPLGHDLLTPLIEMIAWAENNHDKIRAARAAYK